MLSGAAPKFDLYTKVLTIMDLTVLLLRLMTAQAVASHIDGGRVSITVTPVNMHGLPQPEVNYIQNVRRE